MCACNGTLERMKPLGWKALHADEECVMMPDDSNKPVIITHRPDRPSDRCANARTCKQFKPT